MLAVKCTVHDFFTCYDHDTFFWKVYPFFRKNIAKADGKVSYFFGSFLTFPLSQSCRKRRPCTQKTYSSKGLAETLPLYDQNWKGNPRLGVLHVWWHFVYWELYSAF